jgi:hypothetical protein
MEASFPQGQLVASIGITYLFILTTYVRSYDDQDRADVQVESGIGREPPLAWEQQLGRISRSQEGATEQEFWCTSLTGHLKGVVKEH